MSRISIFLKLTPWISSPFYHDDFSLFFCIDPPGNSRFLLKFSFFSYGIPTTFTLPPGVFHWYPQQGGFSDFFWKSPFRESLHSEIAVFMQFVSFIFLNFSKLFSFFISKDFHFLTSRKFLQINNLEQHVMATVRHLSVPHVFAFDDERDRNN